MSKRVKCIDPGTNAQLTLNAEYEVDHETTNMYYLVGMPGGYNKSRFVEVSATAPATSATIFVRCLDDGDGSMLKLGNVYQVLSEDGIRYYLQEFDGGPNGFSKHRFEVVKQPSLAAKIAEPTIKEVLEDIDEERCWKALLPTIDPGHCRCGIHRSMCWIHKDQQEIRS